MHRGINYTKMLNKRRHDAAIEACCRRLAISSLEAMSASSIEIRPYIFGEKPLSVQEYYDFRGTPFHHRSRNRSLTEVSLSQFRGHIGANIDPCPWLSEEPGMPYYLWSISESQTVETSTLDEIPVYTAISHTWGRWEKPSQPVVVEGVNGWLVPENDIFDVKLLPDIVRKVPVKTPYIWFDLLCIPQDRSPRALQEIARQAVIFRGAKYSIAWLNRISDWKGLRATTEWMCMQYLSFSELGDKKSQIMQHATDVFSKASIRTELFEPYTYGPDISGSGLEPSAWFTSLWTLQEACLRPDMLLCSRDWEMLAVGNGVPVPFDGLVALSAKIIDHAPMEKEVAMSHRFDSMFFEIPASEKLGALVRGGQYPRGYIELFALLERTGMEDLHAINRESIMKLGSQRHCKRGRAEAVMSVIGATGWYMEALKHGRLSEVEKELVLGLYPVSFLRETVEMIGARFYSSIIVQNDVVKDIFRDVLVRGSLLPFSTTMNSSDEQRSEDIFFPRWQLDGGDLASVKTWRIEADGSVKIPEAAILTSALDRNSTVMPLLASVQLAYPLDHGLYQRRPLMETEVDRLRSIDLREWEKNWLPFSRNYAVALISAKFLWNEFVRGILLKQTPSGALVKVGVFNVMLQREDVMAHIFRVQSVDWRVL